MSTVSSSWLESPAGQGPQLSSLPDCTRCLDLLLEESHFLAGFGFPVTLPEQGGHVGSSLLLGRLGGVWLVLGEAQVKGAVALPGLTPPGTLTSGIRALPSEQGGGGWRHAGMTTSCSAFPSLIPTGVWQHKGNLHNVFKNNQPKNI